MGASSLQDPSPGGAVPLSAQAQGEAPPGPDLTARPAAPGKESPGGSAQRLRLGRPRDWAIGTGLLIALALAVHYTVGWGPLLAPWRTFPLGLLAWLFLLTALSYALRAVRVYDYFRPSFKGQFLPLLRLTVLHNAANNLMPMRSGEMVFPWLMRRWFGHGFLDSAAALLWIRLLDMHFMGLTAILILYLRSPSWLWWAAAGLWLGMLLLIPPISRMGAGGMGGEPAGVGRIRRLIGRVIGAAPRDPRLVARVYLWTIATWTLKFAAFASVLRHFVPADFWQIMTGVMGAELSSILPFHGVAGSGSYEIAAVAALAPLGIEPKIALAGAVNLHLFVLGTTLLLGSAALVMPSAPRLRASAVAPAPGPGEARPG